MFNIFFVFEWVHTTTLHDLLHLHKKLLVYHVHLVHLLQLLADKVVEIQLYVVSGQVLQQADRLHVELRIKFDKELTDRLLELTDLDEKEWLLQEIQTQLDEILVEHREKALDSQQSVSTQLIALKQPLFE